MENKCNNLCGLKTTRWMVLRAMSIAHGTAVFICFGAYFVFTSDTSKIFHTVKTLVHPFSEKTQSSE